MYPILFQFGPLTIYSFGAFMALAALSAAWVVHAELKRRGYNTELASTMVFAEAIGGLLGARLLFIIEEWNNFLAAPMNYILTGAGFTWYGGFLGGVIAVSWVIKKNKIPWLVGADIAAPALALAYGVGRIGCHVAGDGDWGKVTDVPWGVAYTRAIIGWVDPNTGIPYPPGVRVHPTPIYEFIEGVIAFDKLIDWRRMHPNSGRIGDTSVGIDPADDRPRICHTPGHIGDLAPISIASHMAADAADTVGEGKRRSCNVGSDQPGDLVFFDHPGNREDAAQKTTVPGKSGAGEDIIHGRRQEIVPFLNNEKQTRAEESANSFGEHHGRCQFGIIAAPL